MFDDADVVHTYTRAQALEDGVLVDAGSMAREAGFRVPVALTNAAWVECVAWSEHDDQAKPGSGQSTQGRLWDVLTMAMHAARGAGDASQVPFTVLRVSRKGETLEPGCVDLMLWIHPGDEGEPVCTVLLEGED